MNRGGWAMLRPKCPGCGARYNPKEAGWAHPMSDPDVPIGPTDCVVCPSCNAVAVFTEKMALRAATPEESAAVHEMNREADEARAYYAGLAKDRGEDVAAREFGQDRDDTIRYARITREEGPDAAWRQWSIDQEERLVDALRRSHATLGVIDLQLASIDAMLADARGVPAGERAELTELRAELVAHRSAVVDLITRGERAQLPWPPSTSRESTSDACRGVRHESPR